MTITTTASRWAYSGDGTTSGFAYSSRIFAAADLAVYVDAALQALGSDYTVSGADTVGGGTVTFAAAPAAGASVVLVRQVAPTQETDYQPVDPFPAESHERALDKLTVLVQQLEARLDRILVMAPADPALGFEPLPLKAALAGHLLGFDPAGEPMASEYASGIAVSPFMATVVDDGSGPDALTTLGVTAYGQGLIAEADARAGEIDAARRGVRGHAETVAEAGRTEAWSALMQRRATAEAAPLNAETPAAAIRARIEDIPDAEARTIALRIREAAKRPEPRAVFEADVPLTAGGKSLIAHPDFV